MNLSAPKGITFWIALILAIIALVAFFVPFIPVPAFWVLLVAFIVLMLGNLIKGM